MTAAKKQRRTRKMVAVTLSDEARAKLVRLAESTGMSASGWIEQAIRRAATTTKQGDGR